MEFRITPKFQVRAGLEKRDRIELILVVRTVQPKIFWFRDGLINSIRPTMIKTKMNGDATTDVLHHTKSFFYFV